MAPASMTQNDLDARFHDLLQPIRDLTKNWNVDIAGSLDEYLGELDKVTVTFDSGLTTMNFAEAAMLIQGSACVYSKKVEYLYTLVYQVLDLLANKKKKGKSSIDEDGNDQDAEFNDEQEDEEFLNLDDLQEHKNVYIKEDQDGCKSVLPVPRMPLSLIPLEDGEKGDNPLLSKKGEVLASRNDFKMNTSSVHHNGLLLLDVSHLALLDKSILFISPEDMPDEINTDEVSDKIDAAPPQPSDEDHMDIPLDNADDDDHDMGDPLPPDNPPEEPTVIQEGIERRSARTKRAVIAAPLPKKDPWQTLDPHDTGSKVEKPFKKGKTFKIPDWFEGENKKRKRKKGKESVHKLSSLDDFLNSTYSNKSKFPKNPMEVPSFPVFESLYWTEFKRRKSIVKNKRKSLREEVLEEYEDEEQAENVEAFPDGGDEDDDLDNIEPLVDDNLFEVIDKALSVQNASMTSFRHETSGYGEDRLISTDYEELVRQHVDQYMASAQEYAQITDLSRRVSEWEEKVIPRLQEEDEHEPFDMKRYAAKVIDNLKKGQSVPFKNVSTDKPHFEICRVFLSSLLLANTLNVDIKRKGSLEAGMDKFELELLNTTKHFEQLEEYQAPSTTAVK